MKIVLGSDHGGFELKEYIKNHLISNGYTVIDVGTNSNDSCSRSEYAIKAALKVKSKEAEFGILCCTSAEGVSIAANKVKGIRCGIGYNDEVSHLLREHNDGNMIAFSQKFMNRDDVIRRVDLFLNAKFEGGRHKIRVDYLKDFENK